jgi:transcriptional regulator with XRE-family HTH domain
VGRALGKFLRRLRKRKAKSLKGAAPEIGVSHAYLSKLENGAQSPSDEVLERLATYYDANSDVLAILAGRIPDDVMAALQADPENAARVLRARFGKPQ